MVEAPRILVVEDDAVMGRLLPESLRRAGYATVGCREAEAALELVRRLDRPPELVLLDVELPRMSGRECLEALHRMQPGIRVLVMSGLDETSAPVQAMLAAGAMGVIAKPFRMPQLLSRVAGYLGGAEGPSPLLQPTSTTLPDSAPTAPGLDDPGPRPVDRKPADPGATSMHPAGERLRREVDRSRALLRLYEVAPTLDDQRLYDFALDQAVALTGSEIGFFHLVSENQEEVILTTWNRRALEGCSAGYQSHYPLVRAGNWADCVRERRPLVFNDFPSSPGQKGLPPGHATVRRFMSIPVMERDLVRMIFGVGNKREPYDDQDLVQIQLVASELNKILVQRCSEQRENRLREQLLQAQKMEAVGQLAGGIAHDFNNLLGAIRLQLEALQFDPDLPGSAREVIEGVHRSVDRASRLTLQLLHFSRRQAMQIGEHDLGVLVTDILAMLRPMLDERIEVRLDLAPGPMIFEGDAGMIEQVVTNLCLNARDAMPVGGRLTFRTRPAELPDLLGTEPGSRLREGYVLLEVMDTGTGMDEEVKRHLFEPFFTTKSVGRGSGLGLATVHGIVSQHGGHIDVSSRVGVGSTFAVYLPRSEADPLEAEAPRPESVTDAGSAVLLVEDDPEMQLAMLRGLRRIGHRVVAASSGVQALDVWERFDGAFDVLVTDQVMPGGLSGDSLADLLCQRRPGLGVVIVSGYAAEPGGAPASWRSRYAVLAKPVTLAQLVLAIQRSLPAQPT